MRLVVVESPLSGDFARNIRYARLCCLDCINRGEAPYASHLLLTQFLDDRDPSHRKLGVACGFTWARGIHITRVVYTDLGISKGMQAGIVEAAKESQKIEFRELPLALMAKVDLFNDYTPGIEQ